MQCAMYNVKYAVCSVQYTGCSMQRAVYNIQCAVCIVRSAMYRGQYTLHSVQLKVCSGVLTMAVYLHGIWKLASKKSEDLVECEI